MDGGSGGDNDARKRRISFRSSLSSSSYRWRRSEISDRRDETSNRRLSPSCGLTGEGGDGEEAGSVDELREEMSCFSLKNQISLLFVQIQFS